MRIADVAALAGVSTATVSRALASPEKVTAKTLELVMEAVRRSGYTPNSAARNLRTRRTMMVLVVVPNIANRVFAEILRGIDAELSASGYGLVIGNLDNLPEREPRYVELALSGQVDGVLLMGGRVPRAGTRSMRDAGVPIVGLCAAIPDPSVPNVVVQDREAGRQAVAFLAGLGHRRLGYLSGPRHNYNEVERWAGFREGLAEAGLGEADVVRYEGQFYAASGVEAAKAYLAAPERPTAVFAVSDEMAIAFLKTVRAGGVRVPEELSIVGFDGIDFADYTEPTLTTFSQPRHEIGHTAARVLLQALRGAPLAPEERQIRLPVTLLERASSGPAPAAGRSGSPRGGRTTPRK